MKYLKMFEALEESIVSEIKKIIADNQYITDKDVNEEKLIYSDKWIIFISKDTLAHIKSHMGPSKELGDAPGSYYTANWKEGIKNAISKHEPQVGDKPPFRTAWTGVDAGTNVGFVTIGFDDALKSGISEGYKSYTYERPVRGEKVKETIIVKNEEAEKTNFVTVVGSKIGEVGGKGLVSLWTAYPDYKDGKLDGKEIPMNRNEFQKNGFYFKCSKEFFEAVPAKTNESKTFKYLKTFESFSVNESEVTGFTDEEKLKIKDAAGSKVSVEFADGYDLTVTTDSGSIKVSVEKTIDTKDGSDKYIVKWNDANITTHSKRELFAFSIEEIGQCLQTITSQHSKDKSKYDELRSKF